MPATSQQNAPFAVPRANSHGRFIASFLRKFRRGVQRHGVIGLLGVAAGQLQWVVHNLRPFVPARLKEL